MVITGLTRNQLVGLIPARGFESHHLRHILRQLYGCLFFIYTYSISQIHFPLCKLILRPLKRYIIIRHIYIATAVNYHSLNSVNALYKLYCFCFSQRQTGGAESVSVNRMSLIRNYCRRYQYLYPQDSLYQYQEYDDIVCPLLQNISHRFPM